MPEWYERFFDGLYTRVLGDTFNTDKTAQHVRTVRRLLRLRKGQRVIDVPCGMGRLTLPLARSGLRMTGVDLTAKYLRRARRDAKREGLDVRFLEADMREVDFDEEFHAAFNWFGSFGYFSDEDNLAFSRKAYRALRPGGRFLVEGGNKSWILSNFMPKREDRHGGVRILTRNRFDRRTSRMLSTWTFQRGDRTERHTIKMRMFNGTELRALLRKAGFEEVELHTHPGREPFSRHSRRLVAVARKGR